MEALLGLLFWGGIGYFVYIRYIKTAENDEDTSRSQALKNIDERVSNVAKKLHTSQKSLQEAELRNINSSKDIAKFKRRLTSLRKKAEQMEIDDVDGAEEVYDEIKMIEDAIHPHEVKKLVDKVTGLKSYRALYKKYEEGNYGKDLSYEEEGRIESIYEDAVEKVNQMIYGYFLCADVGLDTPLTILDNIGKVFQNKDEIDKIAETYDYSNITEITYEYMEDLDYEIEECIDNAKENGLDELKTLRSIFENTVIDQEMRIAAIDKYISKSKTLKYVYFNDTGNDAYYNQLLDNIKVQELSKYNIPMIDKFVSRGYTTLEEIINVPAEEMLSWKGIGKVNIKKILYSQNRLRKEEGVAEMNKG